MTTTTKTVKGQSNGNGMKQQEVEAEWADAPTASSLTVDHPAWVPHWSEFKQEKIDHKLTTVPEGSTIQPVVIGKLIVERAYGEPRYFIIEAVGGKQLAMPRHGSLTATLDMINVSKAPSVRIAFGGEAKRARPNQRAAFLYDVRVKPSDALLTKAREDALLPIHKENKAKRDAARAAENNAPQDDGADE